MNLGPLVLADGLKALLQNRHQLGPVLPHPHGKIEVVFSGRGHLERIQTQPFGDEGDRGQVVHESIDLAPVQGLEPCLHVGIGLEIDVWIVAPDRLVADVAVDDPHRLLVQVRQAADEGGLPLGHDHHLKTEIRFGEKEELGPLGRGRYAGHHVQLAPAGLLHHLGPGKPHGGRHPGAQALVQQADIIRGDAGIAPAGIALFEGRPGGVDPQTNCLVRPQPFFLGFRQIGGFRTRLARRDPAGAEFAPLAIGNHPHALGEDPGQHGVIAAGGHMEGDGFALGDAQVAADLQVGDLELVHEMADHRHQVEKGVGLAGGNRQDGVGGVLDFQHLDPGIAFPEQLLEEKSAGHGHAPAEKIVDALHRGGVVPGVERLDHL